MSEKEAKHKAMMQEYHDSIVSPYKSEVGTVFLVVILLLAYGWIKSFYPKKEDKDT